MRLVVQHLAAARPAEGSRSCLEAANDAALSVGRRVPIEDELETVRLWRVASGGVHRLAVSNGP